MGRTNYTAKGAKQYAAQATHQHQRGPNSGGGLRTGGGRTIAGSRTIAGGRSTATVSSHIRTTCQKCYGSIDTAVKGKTTFCQLCRCQSHLYTNCMNGRDCKIPHYCTLCNSLTGTTSIFGTKLCYGCKCVSCHLKRSECHQHNSVRCATAGCEGMTMVPSAYCPDCKCAQCNKSKTECFQHNQVLCHGCKVHNTSVVGRKLCDECRCNTCRIEILKTQCWQHNTVKCLSCKGSDTPYAGVKYCDDCACRECVTETLNHDCYLHNTHPCTVARCTLTTVLGSHFCSQHKCVICNKKRSDCLEHNVFRCECRHEDTILGFRYGIQCKCLVEDCPERKSGTHGLCTTHARCSEYQCNQPIVFFPVRLPYCVEHCCPKRECSGQLGFCDHSCKTRVGKNKPCTHPLETSGAHGHPPDGFHCAEHLMCEHCQELASHCVCRA